MSEKNDRGPMRYHVVVHTITLIHEYPVKYDESAEFALTENHCFGNVITQLNDAEEVCSEYSLCSICASHKARYVGRFDTVEAAQSAGGFDMDPNRIRARLETLTKPIEGFFRPITGASANAGETANMAPLDYGAVTESLEKTPNETD